MPNEPQYPTREALDKLMADKSPVCISLYQPTHRRAPENHQDPIRFKNLVNQLEKTLEAGHDEASRTKLLKPFHDLAENRDFWNHTLDGIGVLMSEKTFEVFVFPRTVGELVVVADSFHVKPLRKFLQSTDQYQLLALSLDEIEIYQGTRNSIESVVTAPEMPKTIKEALGGDVEEEYPNPSPFAVRRRGRLIMNSGNGGGRDEREIDEERFFRAIDTAVHEHVSKNSKLPLVLVALAEHHHHFHKVSNNPYLQTEGVKINPKAVKEDQLRDLAWQAMEPQYHARLDAMKDDFKVAQSRKLGSDELADVAKAAVAGRVNTVFLEENRILRGRIDSGTGKIEAGDDTNPAVDDMLDDLGELVERNGGQVFLIPTDHMPTTTGVAAIYRYEA